MTSLRLTRKTVRSDSRPPPPDSRAGSPARAECKPRKLRKAPESRTTDRLSRGVLLAAQTGEHGVKAGESRAHASGLGERLSIPASPGTAMPAAGAPLTMTTTASRAPGTATL